MQPTTAEATLSQFRQAVYRTLGRRKDTLFELLEAAVGSPGPANLVHLSLAPAFRRRWPSASDALADGQVRPARCRALIHAHLADPAGPGRPVWAGDGTPWPRPAAKASPERTYGHRSTPGIPQDGVVPAWEYEWLVEVPEPGSSWVRPLDVRRRGPRSGTPTEVTIRQLRAALARRPAGAARPVGAYDSTYDPVTFARAKLPLDLLVRLRSNRRFYREPGPYKGRGGPAKHGPVFKLPDPATHGPPDRSAALEDPVHGRVQVDAWERLHVQTAADVPFTVVRVQVERLPRHARTPKPLWLAWVGGPLPADLLDLWRWYSLRFVIEHGFRFLKHDLGWTTVRPAHPQAADRWSWLLALALWALWLARPLVADQRLPWERPLPPERLTPARVRRACAPLFLRLGTPARPVRPRGKAPGRRRGQRPGPRPRHPVVRRHPKRAA
ncbi:MAG TPA: transposase [Micromonosporaceae bacterium]|nr:transposase [Micromonosporaceae bacterium]